MLLGANQPLSPVVTFMTLQFTRMARDCFDALQNWSNEHAYVKAILAGRSTGEITDEEAAQKVLVEYFEKNPDHLPTSNGRRFFCIASYDQRAAQSETTQPSENAPAAVRPSLKPMSSLTAPIRHS